MEAKRSKKKPDTTQDDSLRSPQESALFSRVASLEEKIDELERQSLTAIPNENVTRKLVQNAEDEAFDSAWNGYFYFSSLFEGDGWSPSPVSSTVSSTGLTLVTGSSEGDEASANKSPTGQNIITFEQPSRFRSSFLPAQKDNLEFSVSVGRGGGTADPHYGFFIERGVLKGTCSNVNISYPQSVVELLPVEASYIYMVEARFYPNDKIEFYVSDGSDTPITGQFLRLRGILRTGLPGKFLGPTNPAIDYRLVTKESAVKTVNSGFFEYIQKRAPFQTVQ